MNKVIIVGHPSSGYQLVEAALIACGMNPALPSRRQRLLPGRIHDLLREAHGIAPIPSITDQHGFGHIDVSPVWHGLALDLTMGNLGREPWLWADPQAIHFLDYWSTLDPDSLFVLVYDQPCGELEPSCADSCNVPGKMADDALRNWLAFNDALLRFHFRQHERCVLVHSGVLRGNTFSCIEEIASRLRSPMSSRLLAGGMIHQMPSDDRAARSGGRSDSAPSGTLGPLLDENPQCLELYSELQAAANLPLPAEEHRDSSSPRYGSSWFHEQAMRHQVLSILMEQCLNVRDDLERMRDERKLVGMQYAQACEELEQALRESRQLKWEMENRKQSEARDSTEAEIPAASDRPTGAAERVKSHLSYKLGHLMVTRVKSPAGWLCLPFLMIDEVLQVRRSKAARRPDPMPPIHEYADAEKAEQIKRQLCYRLGHTLVQRAKSPSGWFILPFALIRQVQAFRRSKNTKP